MISSDKLQSILVLICVCDMAIMMNSLLHTGANLPIGK